MPIHDWTRVRANRFHDFHQGWTIAIRDALNAGILPAGYVAMAEQITDQVMLPATHGTHGGDQLGWHSGSHSEVVISDKTSEGRGRVRSHAHHC